jgi:ketosteroid isomerase-like protein
MRQSGRVLILISILLGALGAARAADATPPARDEIVRFVRAYLDANNGADPASIMDMVSRKSEASMAEMGTINRGWEAIRAELQKLAATQGTHTVSLRTTDITPLGPGYVLVVASIDVDLGAGDGEAQLQGAMTLVLEKTSGKWKVLHEHDSLHFPLGDILGGDRD